MRLAAKRRDVWADLADSGDWESRPVFLSGGMTEVIRFGQGEPIVLVPGLAGGWRLLAPMARLLARRHEVILYGLRGERVPLIHSGEETIQGYASDLAALIEHLGLERPTVLGVSFGGAVALELAVGHPRLVGALGLYGVEPRFRMTLGATIARRVLEGFPLPSGNRFLNQFFNLLHGCKPEPGPLADFVVERCWETDQGVMARRLRALEHFDVTDRLWRIDAPTLVMAGARDVIVPLERQRALSAGIGGSRFEVLEGAGHIGFLTHRVAFERHVHRLVRDRIGSLC